MPESSEPGPRQTQGPSLLVPSARPLLTTFSTFLTLILHTLLYHRSLYPARTFITTRAYNLAIHQSRHSGVCTWINDAVSAVSLQLSKAAVERVVFVVHAPKGFRVVERWIFDVGLFPEWGEDASAGDGGEVGAENGDEEEEVNWTDVNENLRGALRRVAYAAEKMDAPPEGSTFSLAVELRDEAAAPIAHPQHWIPSQPEGRPATRKTNERKAPERNTMPIRAVRAGPLFFECWVEQPKAPQTEHTEKPPSNDSNMGPPDSNHPSKDSAQSKDSGKTNRSS